jgi:hypothetical protein
VKFIDPTGMFGEEVSLKRDIDQEAEETLRIQKSPRLIDDRPLKMSSQDDPPGFLGGIARPFKNLWNAITHPGQTVDGAINYLTNTTLSEHIGNTLNQMSTGSFSVLSPLGITLRTAKDNLLLRYDLKNGTNYYWSAQGELLGNLLLEGGTTYLGGRISTIISGLKLGLKPLGLGSTGRTVATNLTEQLAMKEIMSNPTLGRTVMIGMKDSRWLDWNKMQYTHTALDGTKTTIHYVGKFENGVLKYVDDFKFK